tara:strand:- start:5440 stop:6744 length:1305 start_codon:yes stop_codon:yes gene_type:complete
MSYKFSTGSVRKGDIYFEDDRTGAATYIDFGEDTITLRPSASAILYAEDDAVGIGTTNPQTTLHVKGDPGQFRVEDTTVDYAYTVDCDGDGIRTHFGDMTGVGDEDSFMTFGAYTGINRLDTAGRDFHIYGTNTTTGFYFDESAGKFGIATDAPDYTLDVAGDIGVDASIYHNGDDNTFVRFLDDIVILKAGGNSIVRGDPAAGQIYINNGGHNLDLHVKNATSGTLLYTDAGNSRVGIGTDSPGTNLHVKGDDARIRIDGDTDSHPGLELSENGTRKWIIYNNYVNDNLTFKTDGDIRMSIKQGGNVGIGTQAPGSTLHTSGSIGVNVTSFTADASIGITHHTCIVDCGPGGANGSVTLTLPTATNAISGRTYILKRADTGGTAPFSALMTVARNGKPIDGASSNLTLGNGDCYTIQCVNGTAGWIIVGHYVP